MTERPYIGKHKPYPPLSLTVIHAWENRKQTGRKPICRKLLTDLPVETLESAAEKVHWYPQRWKIETFHKVPKSGCRVENADQVTHRGPVSEHDCRGLHYCLAGFLADDGQ